MTPRPSPGSSSRLASRLWKQGQCHSDCGAFHRRHLTLRTSSPYAIRRQQHFLRSVALVAAAGSLATAYQWATGSIPLITDVSAEEPRKDEEWERQTTKVAPPERIDPDDLVFQESRKPAPDASKEETRDQISSQHLQVRKSWENPGVWCWGANDGKVASPGGKENIVRSPKWMRVFDGKLLRDLKLTQKFGAAIDEQGDLLQWGSGFSAGNKEPVRTLQGKNLISIAFSKDRIMALSAHGDIYSLAVSLDEQTLGPKPVEASWLPLWGQTSPISYRRVKPQLGWGERVTSVVSGQDHALALTNSGRVFGFASGNEAFPDRGQLGVPGLTWFTRPKGPYDQAHEIGALHGFKITQVAAGDYHSLALDAKGRLFAWGDNQKGQLGIGETSKETTYYDAPALVPMNKLYAGTAHKPAVTRIFAGGNTTFLAVDATRVALPTDDPDTPAMLRGLGRVTADTWACGHGIWGQLGNGRWTHVQALPTKIAPLSGLFEYDEAARRAVPIRVRALSVGASHVAATLDNVTYVDASARTGANDTNWGADVLFFGNNEYFQLGTGKRNNIVTPTYIQPLDRVAEEREGKRPQDEVHRFHATPMSTVKLDGRWKSFEQRVVCGRGVTAVYSGI